MKKDIIIAGVGGQGIVSIAATIGYAAVGAGLFLKQSEVHGMSQRGGDVYSHFRLSDKEIHSDLIPVGEADLIISIEPLEALRYLPMLSPDGWLITNSNPFINMTGYPDIEGVHAEINKVRNHIMMNTDQMARKLGAPKSSNIIVLGAAFQQLGMDIELLENSLRTLFGRKGEKVVNSNIEALHAGMELAKPNA
jgi:indolepyruvate ferredoxin oxidoreductase beta subunit